MIEDEMVVWHHQLDGHEFEQAPEVGDAIRFDLSVVQGTLKNLLHTTVQKHQFYGARFSLYSNFHIHT